MAAQDAELQLKVSLDLAFFKQQLAGLGQASAGYALPIGFTFDTKALERQITALNKKEITIKVGDTAIESAIKRLETLSNYIGTVRKATSTAIVIETKYKATGDVPAARTRAKAAVATAVKGQSLVDSASYRELQKLYKFADAANLEFERLKGGASNSAAELRRVLAPAFRAVGTDVKAGIKSGLANANTELAQIAAKMGESLLKKVKRSLGIASPSKEFKKIGEDSGEGLEQGLKIGFGEAGDVGVREIEKLFQRLQKEAKAGSALLQAIMAGAMGGVMQLPGSRQRGAGGSIGSMIRQQRAQVQAERQAQAGGLSALMTGMMSGVVPMGGQQRGAGVSIGAMIRQQRTAIQAQRQAEAGSLSALMMGMMGGVVPMPSRPRTGQSIGDLIQKERANARERNRPQRIENLIAALSSASGNLSPAAGVNQRLSAGGVINPGVISSGYIGRSAVSPRFVNYPPTMPAAYEGRFIEPSAYASSLATAGISRFNMGGQSAAAGRIGGVGAGGGSFVPMEAGRSVSSFRQSIQGLITRAKDAAGVIKSQVVPSFKDLRAEVVDVRRRVAMQLTAEGGVTGGKYVTPRGAIKSYGNFPSEGMMTPGGITANTARFRNYSVRKNAVGGRFPLGASYSTQSGGIGSYAFPMAGMMGPSSPLPNVSGSGPGGFGAGGGSFVPPGGPPNPPPGGGGGGMGGFGRRGAGPSTPFATPLGSGYFAVGKGLQSINTAYQQVKPFLQQNRVPLSGAIAELGSEFGNAIKQVLLFGTAYKALAFLTSLPAEAFNAAKGLATYKNQLEAVTSETNAFDQSLAFVDSLATRFNVPLENARQGFVKLYASMQPAGFSQQQIEGLFTGISQATAAFGLSADKVDRVSYAFAQMASKGQIMSEELKGQLGDVLPGALALFAEAAQMSIPEFGQAMEDGAFKGKAMEQVLNNVAILMTSKFGPAAQDASKTLQGAVNQIQNNLKLMYESFTPVVNGFAAAFGPQVNQLIKDVTSTVSALTGNFQKAGEGYSALTPRAQSFYNAVQSIIPSLKQASAAAIELGGKFASLLPIVVQATAAAISFAASPIGRGALIAAVAISGLTATFRLLEVTGIKAATKAVYTFIGGLLAIPQATGVARLAVIALKTAITGLFITGILLGLDYLAGKLLDVGDAANNSARDVRGMRSELDALAGAGDIQETAKQYLKANTDLAIARKNNAKALADVRNAELAVNSSEDPRAALAAVTAAKLNAEKTYAKVLEAQRAVQAARQSRDNAVKIQTQQEVKTQKDLEKIDLQKEEKGNTSKKSLNALVNEDLLLAAETAKAQTKLAAQQSIAMAPDTMQSKRMIAFNSEIRDIFIEIATINAQIDTIDRKRPELIKLGYKAEEISAKKKELNNQLMVRSIELLTAEVQYRNKAKDDAIEEKKQRDEKIKDQLEINRLLEDAAILAGAITPQQAAIRKQRREFDDQMLQLRERGATPEQLSALAAYQAATPQAGSFQESLRTLREEMDKLVSTQEMVKTSASSIGEAFSSAFRDTITGASSAQEALAGFFTNVANSFTDMVSEMIAKWLQAQIIQGFMSLFPGMGSFTGGTAIGQSVSLPSGTGIGAGGGILQNAGGQGFGTFGPNFGIRQFANGGIVQGPTLSLIGEGRFNEAVIPMPDGKSVPVDLGGAAGNNISTNIVVNVNNGQVQSGSGNGGSDLGRKMEGAVKQVIVNELRPGGLLSGGRR